MNDSQFAIKFKHCQTRVCKAHRHYDEGRRGSHFEVGRAMPLAHADIFSCSDRWLVNRLLKLRPFWRRKRAGSGGLVARKTRADEGGEIFSARPRSLEWPGPGWGAVGRALQCSRRAGVGPARILALQLNCARWAIQNRKTREYFKNSFFLNNKYRSRHYCT